MDNKELIELFLQQIKDRNSIIEKLLEERKELVEIKKYTVIKDMMPYIVIIVWIVFYFCTSW